MTHDRATAEVDAMVAAAWELATGQPQKSLELTRQAQAKAQQVGYDIGLARCLRNVAYYHLITSNLPEALKVVNDALSRLGELDDGPGLATAMDIKAVTYWRLGSFDQALQYSFESLELNRTVGDKRGEGWAHHNLGSIYVEVGDFAQAITWFNSAKELFAEIDYEPGILRTLNGLGDLFFEKRDFTTALKYHQECLEGSAAVDLPLFTVGASREIGRCFRELGQLEAAAEYLEKSVAAFDLIDHRESKAETLTDLGLLCAEQGESQTGLGHLARARDLIRGTGAKPAEMRLEQGFSQLYEAAGDHASALEHFKRYQMLREEMYSDESNLRLKNLQVSMETEKAEREAEIHRLRFVELAQMQARLVQSEKMAMLGSLVAGLAHEVNNPIGIINSNTDVSRRAVAKLRGELDNGNAEAGAARATLELLDRNQADTARAGVKIASLIDSLVNFAGLDQAEQQFADINKMLKDTLNLCRWQVADDIELETEFGDLPEVKCNPQELKQVFMTLLMNAADAIDGAGRITITTGRREGQVYVRIADTGRGMDREQLERIFDIGFNDKGPTMRMSVGLANSYNAVHRHGGDMKVQSEPGLGTEFEISLPI